MTWGVGPDDRIIGPTATHQCAEMEAAMRLWDRLETMRRLEGVGAEATLWGAAITRVDLTADGVWVAHNDEYASPVAFCPFCGMRLEETA